MGAEENEKCIVEVVARVRGRLMWLRIMLHSEQRQAAVLMILRLGYVRVGVVLRIV
jgi:hypothetical protein